MEIRDLSSADLVNITHFKIRSHIVGKTFALSVRGQAKGNKH